MKAKRLRILNLIPNIHFCASMVRRQNCKIHTALFRDFLSLMNPLVPNEGQLMMKAFTTFQASVRFLSGMDFLVFTQIRSVTEAFFTGATLKRLLSCVDPFVGNKVGFVTEPFPANEA